jgi:hypothetical protein
LVSFSVTLWRALRAASMSSVWGRPHPKGSSLAQPAPASNATTSTPLTPKVANLVALDLALALMARLSHAGAATKARCYRGSPSTRTVTFLS